MSAARNRRIRILGYMVCAAIAWNTFAVAAVPPASAHAPAKQEAAESRKPLLQERKELFDQVSLLTGIPWYQLAAMDQYDRTISAARKREKFSGLIALYFSDREWAGLLNPNPQDNNPRTIAFFGGAGRDGSGDGLADRGNDLDRLYAAVKPILDLQAGGMDFNTAVWEHYHNPRSVERIQQFARIYRNFGTLDLDQHAFPLPIRAQYTYRDTWGASRGWGGFRIHEGTDLFAHQGVPVRSTSYGVIEVMGWNPYGGWRVGIRDIHNLYHYYAHLSGFNKKLKKNDIVKPGDVIGWVGSSGYGRPGTQGKFPPHLHYGIYRDNGLTEWAFDPYPMLKQWEREERQRGSKPEK